jgi:hypothetical protein
MNVTGLQVEQSDKANTVEAVQFALKYFGDLGYTTSEGDLNDPLAATDVAVLSLPYVGAHIAEGFEQLKDRLNENQNVHWLLMLIKDDVRGKSEVRVDDFTAELNKRGKVDIVTFETMTSERHIPLQTREMMAIMKACDGIHKQLK